MFVQTMLTMLTQIPPFVSGSQQRTLNGAVSGLQHNGAMIEIILRDATSADGLGL